MSNNKDKVTKDENKVEAAANETATPTEIVGINFREAGKIYYFDPAKLVFKVGDKVIASKYAGTAVKMDGVEYTILSEDDILAIVE